MLRIFAYLWEVPVYLWEGYQFKRRWKRIYQEADSIPGNAQLFISNSDSGQRRRVIDATAQVLKRIPRPDLERLTQHWTNLQKRWDSRDTGLSLQLPIFGDFEDLHSTASLYPEIIVIARRACEWNGYADSLASLSKSFGGMFLVVRTRYVTMSDNALDLEIARQLANYLLCANEKKERTDYVLGFHADTNPLVQKWGFETSSKDPSTLG